MKMRLTASLERVAVPPILPITAIRLRERMEAVGISQDELAEKVGATQGAISQILTGTTRNSRLLPKIAAGLVVNLNWLLGLTDDMIDMLDVDDRPLSEDDLAAIKAGQRPNTLAQPHQITVGRQSHEVIVAEMGLVPVREVDLALGFGAAYLDQDISSVVQYFPRAWLDLYTRAPSDKLIITRGSGDSMVPTLFDQDLILIDTSDQTPRLTDQVWAISYCGLGSVKRLRPTKDGGWLLMSDNPTISPITAYDDEMHVLGRVCAYFRKV